MKPFVVIFIALLLTSAIAWKIQPPPSADGKTILTWVSDDNPARRAHIVQFNRLHGDLDLRLDPDNGGMEKVIVQSMGGVGPDLFDCYSPSQLAAYVKAGIAWDVTEELRARGINVEQDVWKAVLPHVLYEGRIYGFPANAAVDALWFNKDILEAARIPYPKGALSWEEFLPLAKRLTVRDATGRVKQFGFCLDEMAWKMLLYQWGGQVFSPDGTRCTLDSPQAIAAMQFLHDLIYVHQVMPSPGEQDAMAQEGGWGSTTMKLLGAGRVATAIGGRWWLCTLRNYQSLRLGACEAPHGPLRVAMGYGKSTLINRNSPHRTEALQFLMYLASPQYSRLLNQQADGLGPMPRFCTDETLQNPEFPGEDFHGVFRDVMTLGEPERCSPYVNAALVDRVINKQLDLMRRNAKSAAEAMRSATQQINDEIQLTLRRDPRLRERYMQTAGSIASGEGGSR